MGDGNSEITLDDILDCDWDALLREIETERKTKRLRRDNPYILDLIRALHGWENGLARKTVLHFVRKNRERLGLPIPRTFEDTVQQSCERFCEDSEVFKSRCEPASEALFSWPLGSGAGHWALKQANADRWIAAHMAKRRLQISRYQP